MQNKITLAGIVGLALSAASLDAQNFSYQTRDLLATFSRVGSADLEVDLGSIDAFKSLAPNTTITLGSRYDPNAQLLNTFGTVNSLSFAVIGTQRGAGTDAANTSWFTLKRLDSSAQSVAPDRYTASKTQIIQSDISGIAGDGSTSGALHYSPTASYPPSTATAIVIPTTGAAAADSFTSKYNGIGGLGSTLASPGIENTTPGDFSTAPGESVVSDLYEYAPGNATEPAAYLGDFTLLNDGELTFTAAPEPGTITLVVAGAVAFFVWRRWLPRRASTK